MPGPQRPRARLRLALASITAGLVLASAIPFASASAAEPPASMLLQWNEHAISAIYNLPGGAPAGAGQTPGVGSIHLAMVETAVYDAVNAIDRGHEPYLRNLPRAPRTASKAAAVATAAHHVLVDEPTALTSFSSRAYAALWMSSGPAVRKRDARPMANGFTLLTQANGSLTNIGSSGRHWPRPVPAVNEYGT